MAAFSKKRKAKRAAKDVAKSKMKALKDKPSTPSGFNPEQKAYFDKKNKEFKAKQKTKAKKVMDKMLKGSAGKSLKDKPKKLKAKADSNLGLSKKGKYGRTFKLKKRKSLKELHADLDKSNKTRGGNKKESIPEVKAAEKAKAKPGVIIAPSPKELKKDEPKGGYNTTPLPKYESVDSIAKPPSLDITPDMAGKKSIMRKKRK